MKGTLLLESPSQDTVDSHHPYERVATLDREDRPRRIGKRPLAKGVSDLKLLFDTYFKPV